MIPRGLRRGMNAVLGRILTSVVQPIASPEPIVLVVRPDHLGDVLFVTPGLQWWHEHVPGYRLALAIGPWSHDVVAYHPAVDTVLEIPFPGFTRQRHHRVSAYTMLLHYARQLRHLRPVAAVLLRDDHWWGAWLTQQAGIPIRVGADHPLMRPFLTHPIQLTGQHWVQRNVALLAATAKILGIASLSVSATPTTMPLAWFGPTDASTAAQALLRALGVNRPFVVLHPGAGVPVKHWPVLRWATLARLLNQAGYPVLVTGTQAEQSLVEMVANIAGPDTIACAGKTTVPVLAEVLRQAALVVGPDTGPLHIAVAVGTPTVHLFGPSNAASFGPWGDPEMHRVVHAGWQCRHCENLSPGRRTAGCLTALSVSRVAEVCFDVLDHAKPA